jgi:hypothetical protein
MNNTNLSTKNFDSILTDIQNKKAENQWIKFSKNISTKKSISNL